MEDISKGAKSKQEIQNIVGTYRNKFWGSHSCNAEGLHASGIWSQIDFYTVTNILRSLFSPTSSLNMKSAESNAI
jgi:hypothetical protein